MSPKKSSGSTATRSKAQSGEKADAFSAEERAAMRERAREVKSQAKASKADGEAAVLEKISEMPEPDRAMASRIHAIVMTAAPGLTPRTWYGMPAYATPAGKVVCFFQAASKFNARYATFGFSDTAALDDGTMWPVAFALTELTPAVEARIAESVARAAGEP